MNIATIVMGGVIFTGTPAAAFALNLDELGETTPIAEPTIAMTCSEIKVNSIGDLYGAYLSQEPSSGDLIIDVDTLLRTSSTILERIDASVIDPIDCSVVPLTNGKPIKRIFADIYKYDAFFREVLSNNTSEANRIFQSVHVGDIAAGYVLDNLALRVDTPNHSQTAELIGVSGMRCGPTVESHNLLWLDVLYALGAKILPITDSEAANEFRFNIKSSGTFFLEVSHLIRPQNQLSGVKAEREFFNCKNPRRPEKSSLPNEYLKAHVNHLLEEMGAEPRFRSNSL